MGQWHDAGAFFGLLFSLVLVVSVAESWGLLIGGVCMDPKTAHVRRSAAAPPAHVTEDHSCTYPACTVSLMHTVKQYF
jgi:hypothetical protein